jgi:hypothetical protein
MKDLIERKRWWAISSNLLGHLQLAVFCGYVQHDLCGQSILVVLEWILVCFILPCSVTFRQVFYPWIVLFYHPRFYRFYYFRKVEDWNGTMVLYSTNKGSWQCVERVGTVAEQLPCFSSHVPNSGTWAN